MKQLSSKMTKVNEHIPKKLPILIQVSSTLIIVIGIVGLLFFATASIYQYYNPQFLIDISSNIPYKQLNAYIIILAILYAGLIISALLIIKLKKAGLYLFFSVFALLLINELFFENILIINHIIIGVIGLTFVIYYRRFK